MEARSVSQQKLAAGIVAAAVMIGSLLGVAAVSAQSGPQSSCDGDVIFDFGDQFFGLEDFGNRLLSTVPASRTFALPSPLAAGEYSVTAVSYDGYLERETINPQEQEQWFAEFLAADGSVLAVTGSTEDLEDGVTEAQWSGSLGDVTLGAEAVSIRTTHAAPGSLSVNSVRPVCLGVTGGPDVDPGTDPGTEPEPEPAPADSSVTVDYDSDATQSSSVAVVCGDLGESATGDEIDLTIESVPAGAECTISFSDVLDCTATVDPVETAGASTDGSQVVNIPAAGGTAVVVDVDCTDPATSDSPSEPVVTTPTTTPAAEPIEPEVQAQIETNDPVDAPAAPTAQPQIGTPTFTG